MGEGRGKDSRESVNIKPDKSPSQWNVHSLKGAESAQVESKVRLVDCATIVQFLAHQTADLTYLKLIAYTINLGKVFNQSG